MRLLRVLVGHVVELVKLLLYLIRTLVHLVIVIITVILVVQRLYVRVLVLRAPLPIVIMAVMKVLVLICVIKYVLVGYKINLLSDVLDVHLLLVRPQADNKKLARGQCPALI